MDDTALQPAIHGGQGEPRVLVFDSGVGGLSVFSAIRNVLPDLDFHYLADNRFAPYGDKPDGLLAERLPRLIRLAADRVQPDIIVVACNTASTLALAQIRAVTSCPVVGVVPPVKPAARLTKTGTFCVLGTPATVRREYTDALIAAFAAHARVIRHGSVVLVRAAERLLRGEAVDEGAVAQDLETLFAQEGANDIDVIALACTHFPLVVDLMSRNLPARARPGIQWLDSGTAIARRVAHLLTLEPASGPIRTDKAIDRAGSLYLTDIDQCGAATLSAYARYGLKLSPPAIAL